MGQAKIRGSFEERKAEAIEDQKEQDRLDAWLFANRPIPKRRARRPSTAMMSLAIMGAAVGSSAMPYYSHDNMPRR